MEKLITADEVKDVLQYDRLIDVMEKALVLFSKKNVVQPVRTVLPVKKEGGFFGVMPSVCEDSDILGVKLVTFFPNNTQRYGVATHNAVIVMFEIKTGLPKAIMDGEIITTMRTAAVSAVATKYLAPSGTRKLAILGAGVQARSHYHALSKLQKFEEITVWSRTFDSAKKCADEIGGVACHTAEEAVKDADVIVTVTAATTPILELKWVKPTAHINAVGACQPDWQEISPELMRSSVLYVDSKEAAVRESGDVILSKAEIYSELGEMISGEKEARRESLTILKSLGMAIEDSMAGQLVLDLLNEKSHQSKY
ncbi:hypothetical protein ACF0H5_000044 [Mactra antiquata]